MRLSVIPGHMRGRSDSDEERKATRIALDAIDGIDWKEVRRG